MYDVDVSKCLYRVQMEENSPLLENKVLTQYMASKTASSVIYRLCAGATYSRVFSVFFEKNQMDSQGWQKLLKLFQIF